MTLNPHHTNQPVSSTLTPSEALDRLISTDLAHGHVTADLDPSTLGTLLSTITPKPLSWLWPGLIPRGTLTLLDGDPGVGTSLFALTLAACLSAGKALPDQTPLTQGKVLLLSPHADPASTLAPRLSAAGADLSHILLLTTLPLNPTPTIPSPTFTTRPFVLPRDLSVLTSLIEHYRPALVILDHLSALIPSAPLSRLARPMLSSTDPCAAGAPDLFTALAHLATATDCAILLVRHTSHGRPLSERYGTAPVQLLLLPDPRAQGQRLLCTAKNTLGAPVHNQTYQIVPTSQDIPRLHWLASNPALTSALCQAAYSSLSPNRQSILRTLAHASGPLGPQDIAARTGLAYDLARRLLSRMNEANEVVRVSYGAYTSLDHPCLASLPTPEPSWAANLPGPDLSLPALTAAQNLASPSNTPLSDTPVTLDSLSRSPSSTISSAPHALNHCVQLTPSDLPVTLDPLDPSGTLPHPLSSPTPELPVPTHQASPPHRASITTTSAPYTFSDLPAPFPPPPHPFDMSG